LACDMVDWACADVEALLPRLVKGLAGSIKAHINKIQDTQDKNNRKPSHSKMYYRPQSQAPDAQVDELNKNQGLLQNFENLPVFDDLESVVHIHKTTVKPESKTKDATVKQEQQTNAHDDANTISLSDSDNHSNYD